MLLWRSRLASCPERYQPLAVRKSTLINRLHQDTSSSTCRVQGRVPGAPATHNRRSKFRVPVVLLPVLILPAAASSIIIITLHFNQHTTHFQRVFHVIAESSSHPTHFSRKRGIQLTSNTFCTQKRHPAHFQCILHAIAASSLHPTHFPRKRGIQLNSNAFCTQKRHPAHLQRVLHAIVASSSHATYFPHKRGI